MTDLHNDNFVAQRSDELAQIHHQKNYIQIDRMFVALMIVQWVASIIVVLTVSPLTWIGEQSLIHTHLWAAIILGGLISSAPIFLGIFFPGRALTRHVIAIAQALWGSLLIHLTGGRIETHFHVFGSLAFIAFYRDWRVLVTMTIVVASDHAIRGIYFPLSVYGIVLESPYRWIEHAAWVVFEDVVLVFASIRGRKEAKAVCDKQAELELTNQLIEQKVQERSSELKDAKIFLQSILDSINAHICVLDLQGNIVETNAYWNRYAIKNGGTGIGVGTNYIEVCRNVTGDCKEGANSVADAIESVIAGDQAQFVSEYPCHTPTAKSWYQVSITPLLSHRRGAAVIAHSNITERVLAQEELMETSQHLELLSLVAKYTDNAVVITDSKGQIEWVNTGFTRMTGYSLEEVQGKTPGRLLQGPETSQEKTDYMREMLKMQQGFDVEILNYNKSGKPYWVAIEARPIRDEEGKVVKFIAIESDISEKRERENEKQLLSKQLQDTARQAGMAEVATGILHNVGNVLNSVNVSATLIKERLNASPVEVLTKAAQVIKDNSQELNQFMESDRGKHFPMLLQQLADSFQEELDAQLNEIQALSKNVDHIKEIVSMQQSFAKQSTTIEPITPTECFEDAINIHGDSLQKHQVSIVKEFEPVPDVCTKRHEVIQILVNLIKNGQQAMDGLATEEKLLKLRIGTENNYVCFEVSDNGVGISKANLKKIFQHGFTTKKDGHGFGLHSCANTANSLGGNLTVFSQGEGKGATFKLKLPLETCNEPSDAPLKN